jgi:hypothetical protein
MIVFDLQYFPPITFFVTLYEETNVYLDIYEIYRKMSFRNRCLISGSQKITSLSVPLKDGRNQQLPMNEVLISDSEKWQSRHFKSIQSSYNRSPFFEHYQEELALLFQNPVDHLADWNIQCLNWVKKKTGWPAEVHFTQTAIPFQAEGIDDRRDLVLPKNYNSWKPVKYRQVFEERTGFIPNLSVLDLLFNTGPQSGELLREASMRV